MSHDAKPDKRAVAHNIFESFKIEPVLNREGDQLPFGLFHPASEGKITWNCGPDADENVVSVFKFDDSERGTSDKKCAYVTYERACEIRDLLRAEGWLPIVPPKVELTHPDTNQALTRKQKRRVARKLANMSKRGAETGDGPPVEKPSTRERLKRKLEAKEDN